MGEGKEEGGRKAFKVTVVNEGCWARKGAIRVGKIDGYKEPKSRRGKMSGDDPNMIATRTTLTFIR